jgi:cation transport ATPase
MFDEGSKPQPGPDPLVGSPALRPNAPDPELRAAAWLGSPWIPVAGTGLGALILAGIMAAATRPDQAPVLWPMLARQYWLIAALAVALALGLGRPLQLAALKDLAVLRISLLLLVALGADAGLLAGVLCGTQRAAFGNLEAGLFGFLLAVALTACALSGDRLLAPRSRELRRAGLVPPAVPPGEVTIRPGAPVPCDGIVVAGRSEVDDGMIGGAVLGSVRVPGDTVRRGARNGDGTLIIDPMVEPPLTPPDYAAAAMFPAGLERRGPVLLAGSVVLTAVLSGLAGTTGLTRLALALTLLAATVPVSLSLVRPLVLARARGIARRLGWQVNGTAAIEELAEVTALACGRGGVLTRTELEILAIHPAVDVEAGELVAAATSIAQSSAGVWAQALLRYAVARKMRLAPLTEWSEQLLETGFGLRARTQGGQELIAGSRDWVAGQGIRTSLLEAAERESLTTGRRSLWVAQVEPAPVLIGVIVAGERLKPGAAEMCKNAKRFGLTGALLDRQGVDGGAELARYLGLRFVEDDTLARKAMETEWNTARLRPVIAQHHGDPLPDAPLGPRLLLGARFDDDLARAVAGGWAAATSREDPRLIMDLLRLARATRRRTRFGYLIAVLFTLPSLALIATLRLAPEIMILATVIGIAGVVINAQLLGFVASTAAETEEG